jgi:DNA polymerase delta subunit 1
VIRAIWTLDTCAPIVGSDVLCFSDERELLRSWGKFFRSTDPDLLIGYNIVNFDFPYLINRAAILGVEDFPYWGRMIGSKLRMKDTTFSSKAYGTRDSKEITIEGRVQFDLLQAVQRDHKLSSYSLNSVSAHFLGEQKEDVHHSAISELQAGNAETRRRLAVYCLKDAYLPQRLLDKLMYMYNYIEMARVTGVPLSFLLSRGQSIKVMSQILRKAAQRGLLVPHIPKKGQGDQAEGGVAFEGATVLDAKAGYYEVPIATLDFASLYPSIMMAHNLCYSTLVPPDAVGRIDAADLTKSPTGDVFVRANKTKGILPEILEELLSARKRAKADLKKAQDPLEKAVLDGRQLALKVSANSVYGFTGATVGALPCLEISSSTTSFGRDMIDQTRDLVLKRYNTANGYAANADVIYGDTDSVMIKFNVADLKEAMRLGEEAAEYVSATFIKPIKLEFEKVYYPYLLISKKRYAGLLWTKPEKHDYMDTKGIETVRRDNCLLVRQVIETCLRKILIDRDVPGAVEYVKRTISDLLMNRMDLSLLVVTKGLTQEADKYDNKAAHVELAKRMKERDPATAPVVGDRIAYVIVKAAKNAKGFEKSEDPIYALENNLPIDYQHYLDHYLDKPLCRIFDPIMKDAKSKLLKGDHTLSIAQPTPSSKAGGIMQFAKVRLSCVGCRASITDEKQSRSLCTHCLAKEPEHLQKALDAVNGLERDFNRLWTQCQRCQGSLHQDVLCTSRDCPIFYRRKKVQKDLLEAETTLKRFDW